MNFTIAGIALAASLALGGFGGYKATRAHYEHVLSVNADAARQAVEAANQKAENAASDYEVWKSLQRPKTVTITREVAHEVQIDSGCSGQPIPPGLRDALAKAAADADQPGAADPVPAASGAHAFDLGGLGARIHGFAGGTAGLPSQTQSPR